MKKTTELLLHAAAVASNDCSYIFVAPTGFGKTTLVAYLTELGYTFISDDQIKINASTLCIHSEPQPLHLRKTSISVLQNHGIIIDARYDESLRRVVYLPSNYALGDYQISKLFFIQRNETENSCSILPANEAVQLFMQNLFPGDLDVPTCLKCAIKLVPICRRLLYVNMRYVCEVLKDD